MENPRGEEIARGLGRKEVFSAVAALVDFPPPWGSSAHSEWRSRIVALLDQVQDDDEGLRPGKSHLEGTPRLSRGHPIPVAQEGQRSGRSASKVWEAVPSPPLEERKRGRACGPKPGDQPLGKRLRATDGTAAGPLGELALTQGGRKRKFQEEPRLTKRVPLGEDEARTIIIGAQLSETQERALVAFLRENADVFAWEPSDLPGIPREVIEHHLAVCPDARPVKQKVRRQAQDRQDFIVEQVHKLKKAKAVREVLHPTWIANPVVVPK